MHAKTFQTADRLRPSHLPGRRAAIILSLVCAFCLSSGALAAPTTLARDGKAHLDIVISPDADEIVTAVASQLAAYLERISGAAFEVRTGDGASGLVVGVPKTFSRLPLDQSFEEGAFSRDDYRIASTGEALFLLGATPLAVEFAVWDLLHRFGYRLYFPTNTWEVVPERSELTIELDVLEKPDYFSRDAPRGGMRMNLRQWGYSEEWKNWRVRNRAVSSFNLHTGHEYMALMRRNQAAFDANPEFYAEVNGKREVIRGNTKFCIGNPDLRELVVADAIRRIEANPQADSISLDPSDGSHWCECDKCAALGSVSDRVVVLCNQVAKALETTFEKTYYIGIYAYNDYSPAPTIEVHPNVIVSLATAFIRGGQTFEEMLTGWSAKADMLGIREYYGVPAWNSSMPGAARVASPEYVVNTIRTHFEAGARFINAESDDAWGANGLGHYLATRLLWDVESSPEAVLDDFLEHAFGAARAPMQAFYELILNKPLHSDHMMAVMYGELQNAQQLTDDPRVLERIKDLVLYTRYVDLQRQWEAAQPNRKQETFDTLATFVWRSRKHSMADSMGVFSYMNRQQRSTDAYGWIPGSRDQLPVPPERLRVRGEEPFSDAEIEAMLKDGLERHERLDFELVGYSDELVPAAARLNLRDAETVMPAQRRSRGKRIYYSWVENPPHLFNLRMVNGLITHYRDRGDATIALRPINEALGEAVAAATVPPDGEVRELAMRTTYDGLHEIIITDGMDSSSLEWEPGTHMTLKLDFGPHYDYDEQHLYFYVPKGTTVLGGYAQEITGALIAPDGEATFDLSRTMGYFQTPVPEGQDGRLWHFKGNLHKGRFMLMTVPPYVAGKASELLLPKEVVEADAPPQ